MHLSYQYRLKKIGIFIPEYPLKQLQLYWVLDSLMHVPAF
jgi:hypothetical protein